LDWENTSRKNIIFIDSEWYPLSPEEKLEMAEFLKANAILWTDTIIDHYGSVESYYKKYMSPLHNTAGGAKKERVLYNNRTYVVRNKNNERYILCNHKKMYLANIHVQPL